MLLCDTADVALSLFCFVAVFAAWLLCGCMHVAAVSALVVVMVAAAVVAAAAVAVGELYYK
jgi:hypothetical protein